MGYDAVPHFWSKALSEVTHFQFNANANDGSLVVRSASFYQCDLLHRHDVCVCVGGAGYNTQHDNMETLWFAVPLISPAAVCCRKPEDLSSEVIQIHQREIVLKEQNYALNSR